MTDTTRDAARAMFSGLFSGGCALLCIVLVLGCASSRGVEDQAYLLRYVYGEGEAFQLRRSIRAHSTQDNRGLEVITDTESTELYGITVTSREADRSVAEVEYLDRTQRAVVGTAAPEYELISDLSALSGRKTLVALSAQGHVAPLEGFESLPTLEVLDGMPLDPTRYLSEIGTVFPILPEEPVRVGQPWSYTWEQDEPLGEGSIHTVMEITNSIVGRTVTGGADCLRIRGTLSISGAGQVRSGGLDLDIRLGGAGDVEMIFDPHGGRLHSVKTSFLTYLVAEYAALGISVPQTIESTIWVDVCGEGPLSDSERGLDVPDVPRMRLRSTTGWVYRLGSSSSTSLSPEAAQVRTRVREKDGMVMVYVPAGEFVMGGSGLHWNKDHGLVKSPEESPAHTVYLDAYWIDQTEVTVGMFRRFVQDTGYRTTAERQGWGHPWTNGPQEAEWPAVEGVDWLHPRDPRHVAPEDHPVVQISWEDAAAYCEWVGAALPTEAQWEKAARGEDGRTYPWGEEFDGQWVNYCDARSEVQHWRDADYDDGYSFTSPVGSYPQGASPYGVLDMAGNVWEWVQDWYDPAYYDVAPHENPLGPASGTVRAMRGAAWYDAFVHVTRRWRNPPDSRCDDVGFRCAMQAR